MNKDYKKIIDEKQLYLDRFIEIYNLLMEKRLYLNIYNKITSYKEKSFNYKVICEFNKHMEKNNKRCRKALKSKLKVPAIKYKDRLNKKDKEFIHILNSIENDFNKNINEFKNKVKPEITVKEFKKLNKEYLKRVEKNSKLLRNVSNRIEYNTLKTCLDAVEFNSIRISNKRSK